MIFNFFKKKKSSQETETPEKILPEKSSLPDQEKPLSEKPKGSEQNKKSRDIHIPDTFSEPEKAQTPESDPKIAIDLQVVEPESAPKTAAPDSDLQAQGIEPAKEQFFDSPPIVPKESEKEENESSGLLGRLASGLKKTRDVLNMDINELFSGSAPIDESVFENLEEILLTADFGMEITIDIMEKIRRKSFSNTRELHRAVKEELAGLFVSLEQETRKESVAAKPLVIMVVGVNGTGKTTTLGKLSARYSRQSKKVLIAAADTFRAAAIEQLEVWADKTHASVVRHKEGADPSAVAYDALEASMARGVDVLLVDTAGRLHTQKNLMEELKKIKRTLSKKMPGAPHEILMVLDATTGQNAISQAKIFHEAVGVSQLALTKLDGTAKGGIVAAISHSLQIPVTYIGVGEQVEDLQPFDSKKFVQALFQ